ncbi:MAG TPA: NAD(P)/FAD-dependent oxidoreductase [Solirubrobacteraceae bacterium]|nr:NAD(P)/FAD-dependent oxidoreductase [Solirubrobacteraceae bacterium]
MHATGQPVEDDALDVLVIGGGQAGLTAGHYLRSAQLRFAILEAGGRVGDAWRRRWDSLELFTTARYSTLPGLPFPGDQERFPGKDEVADYLAAYARALELPVQLDTRVTALRRGDGGYEAHTDGGVWRARQVIVATGAYQRPYVPPVAAKLGEDVTQLHSAGYRNAADVPGDDALVVGGGNSGVQIAQELAGAGRRVSLAQGKAIRRVPRRILGRSLHWWGDHLGLITAPLDSLRGRTQRKELLVGTGPRELAREHGVTILPRVVDAEGSTVAFADGRRAGFDAVLWATGFRSDYSWIDAPVLDERGTPVHRRGVTKAPGLFFLGMHFQHSRGSALIAFVRDDAAFVVDRIRERR